jgi:DNA transformation protein and related proteins
MPDKKLSDLKNIGTKSEVLLNQVGIITVADLDEVGAVGAWKRVRDIEPSASLVGVYALQGALMNIHWNALPQDIKDDLRHQWEAD